MVLIYVMYVLSCIPYPSISYLIVKLSWLPTTPNSSTISTPNSNFLIIFLYYFMLLFFNITPEKAGQCFYLNTHSWLSISHFQILNINSGKGWIRQKSQQCQNVSETLVYRNLLNWFQGKESRSVLT